MKNEAIAAERAFCMLSLHFGVIKLSISLEKKYKDSHIRIIGIKLSQKLLSEGLVVNMKPVNKAMKNNTNKGSVNFLCLKALIIHSIVLKKPPFLNSWRFFSATLVKRSPDDKSAVIQGLLALIVLRL